MLTEIDSLVACHECDALHRHHSVENGETAQCIRCGAKLYSYRPTHQEIPAALSIAGLVFYVIMVSFPFLGISTNGIERHISLVGSCTELFQRGFVLLAILVSLVLIVVPLLKVLGIIFLLFPIRVGILLPGTKAICKAVERLVPWNMTEIYLVGIIVTFVKLSSLAFIIYGIAFWGFIGFVLVMTWTTASVDFPHLWRQIELQIKNAG